VYSAYAADPGKQRAWDAANPGNAAIRDEVVSVLMPLLGEASAGDGLVLDAGCGTGWWLERAAAAGVPPARLAGVDMLDARVAAARRRVPGATIHRADVRTLPLDDESCAMVTLLTVLSALAGDDDVRRALREARRVLAPGGRLAIWEPRVPTANRHTRRIALRAMREVLGAGLEVRTMTVAPPLARRAPAWYGALSRVPLLRTHRLVVARAASG
jgi:ubiquinone/menaquinone biosynthesis C-methylase UbiE